MIVSISFHALACPCVLVKWAHTHAQHRKSTSVYVCTSTFLRLRTHTHTHLHRSSHRCWYTGLTINSPPEARHHQELGTGDPDELPPGVLHHDALGSDRRTRGETHGQSRHLPDAWRRGCCWWAQASQLAGTRAFLHQLYLVTIGGWISSQPGWGNYFPMSACCHAERSPLLSTIINHYHMSIISNQ